MCGVARASSLSAVGGQQVVDDVQCRPGAICGGQSGPVGGDDGGADRRHRPGEHGSAWMATSSAIGSSPESRVT